jgi:hypothetical protein
MYRLILVYVQMCRCVSQRYIHDQSTLTNTLPVIVVPTFIPLFKVLFIYSCWVLFDITKANQEKGINVGTTMTGKVFVKVLWSWIYLWLTHLHICTYTRINLYILSLFYELNNILSLIHALSCLKSLNPSHWSLFVFSD